ncbi:MAG: hypothetical protein AAF439_06605, partial [Pseudomonadota bacterium]
MVHSRQVWYFHGFDPATTGRYRRIFAAASERLGVFVEDLPDDGEGWRARRDGVTTNFRYCRYEELVRDFQYASLTARVLRGFRSILGYWRDGALKQMRRLGPRNFVLAISPVVIVPILLTIGLMVFGTIAILADLDEWWIFGLGALIWTVAASVVAYPMLYLHLVADLFAFMQVIARGEGDEAMHYGRRVSELTGEIEAGTADETLIVGHSLGGIAAIMATADLLERWPQERSLSLMTLGSTHGTVLVQQGAGRDELAEAIRKITADPRVFWVDVTSPRDAFCLPLIDPVLLAGGVEGGDCPRVISARLRRAPAIPGDRRTVFAAMRRHMGYLLTPEPG